MSAVLSNPKRQDETIKPVTDETDPVFMAIRRCNDPEDPLGVVEADEGIQEDLLKRGGGVLRAHLLARVVLPFFEQNRDARQPVGSGHSHGRC